MPVTPLARQCQIRCASGWAPRGTLASPVVPRQSKTTHITIKNTHTQTHTRTLHHGEREQSGSGPVKPSNLSPPDKHPLDTVTFSPTQAECEGCKCAWLCARVPLRVFMCACLSECFIYACTNNRPFIQRAKLMYDPAVLGNKSPLVKDERVFFFSSPP